jgi:hypothetical protein
MPDHVVELRPDREVDAKLLAIETALSACRWEATCSILGCSFISV